MMSLRPSISAVPTSKLLSSQPLPISSLQFKRNAHDNIRISGGLGCQWGKRSKLNVARCQGADFTYNFDGKKLALDDLVEVGVVRAYASKDGSGPFPTEFLVSADQEGATTTGRPRRRIGWLDIVALKYCCQINGFSSLILAQLHVLSVLSKIELGVSYKMPDGTPLASFPSDRHVIEQIKVEYEVMPGWQTDISSVRDYSELPKAARNYVERIEELVGLPIHYVCVGPGRESLIYK